MCDCKTWPPTLVPNPGGDADGDTLNYSLLFSPDGSGLHPVVTGVTDPAADFDPVATSGSAPSLGTFVRVVASDGFNATPAETSLDFGGSDDAVRLRQYNTHGGRLPGMCSRDGCFKVKRHTLVAQNVSAGATSEVELTLVVVAVPDTLCTVNGVGAGEVIPVASGIALPPSGRTRQNIDLTFDCGGLGAAAIDLDFVLSAQVRTTNGFDLTPANNAIEKAQTVK